MPAPENTKPAPPKPPAQKPRKRWLLIGIAVLVAGGLAVGGTWFYARNAEKQAAAKAEEKVSRLPAAAQYFALDPAFVVNMADASGATRYLQIEVQLMARDPAAIKDFEQHAPAIRARLLMLFSQQSTEGLVSRAGKEKLQAAALAEARKLLKAETGKPGADALLFTSFVMQ